VSHLTETDLVPLCLLQVDIDYDIGVVLASLTCVTSRIHISNVRWSGPSKSEFMSLYKC